MSAFVTRHRNLLALSVLAIAAVALVVASTVSATNETSGGPGLPGPGNIQECLHGDPIEVAFSGLGTFYAELDGSVAARTGKSFVDRDGRQNVPLQILGTASRDYVDGLGEIMVWLDHTRPVKGSLLQETTPGQGFPAVQHMRFHIFLETDALPGKRFRSIRPLHVASDAVRAFPPAVGTQYRLMEPIELEDVADPGRVAVEILSGAPRITGSRPG